MSDEKQAKEVKDEELDKVSGGTNSDTTRIKEDNAGGKHNVDAGVGGKHKMFSTGGHEVK